MMKNLLCYTLLSLSILGGYGQAPLPVVDPLLTADEPHFANSKTDSNSFPDREGINADSREIKDDGVSRRDLKGNDKGLKDYYATYFPIGVAVSPGALNTDEAGLIKREFNSITAENAMKMGPIHPKVDEYFWTHADSIAAFAGRNMMKLRGHTLCWHSQTPKWMFTDAKGDTVSKAVLLERLKDHITTVVSRYKGKIYAWDVVNEVISDKPDEFYRKSAWYKICGEEFISLAFKYAHEADPKALLFYNDYNEIDPIKREKIFKLVTDLKKAGVPIHGVGLQGHWALNEPSHEQLEKTLERFAESGLAMQITELDISVHPKEHSAREKKTN